MRRKKFLSSLLVFAMMMWMLPIKIFGAGAATLSVSTTAGTVYPGDEIIFNLTMGPVDNVGNIEVNCIPSDGLTIKSATFNQDLKNLTAGKFALGDFVVEQNGTARFTGTVDDSNGYSSSTDTILGTFTCIVKDNASGDQTISLANELIGDALDFSEKTVTTNGATTTITPAPVDPTGVSLDKREIKVIKGGADQTLTASIAPEGATGTLVWSSSNSNVATVTDNNDNTATVTINDVGTANITVAIQGTNYSDVCTVNVGECPHENRSERGDYIAPTCETEGQYKYFYCNDCGNYIITNEDGTKVIQVTDNYYATQIPGGHIPSEEWSYDEDYHWHICTRTGEGACGGQVIEDTKAWHEMDEEYVSTPADDDHLGQKGWKCKVCPHKDENQGNLRYYLEDNTCPNKYPDDKHITGNSYELTATGTFNGKEVKVILQDPLEIGEFVERISREIEIKNITDLTENSDGYDNNIKIEKAYKADIVLKLDGEEIHEQLSDKVRLLLEIPDDPNDPNDDWDDDELQVQRIEVGIGNDIEYVERIEYQVYDADGNFVKVVEKGYIPEEGETVRKFMVVWTDHFSDYSVIDPEDKAETPTTTGETDGNGEASYNVSTDEKNDTAKKSGLKTGETIEMYVTFSMILFSAAGILLISLKKRKKAE